MTNEEKSKAAALLGRSGGKKGGKARTEVKASAARENGKKGGRPARIAADKLLASETHEQFKERLGEFLAVAEWDDSEKESQK